MPTLTLPPTVRLVAPAPPIVWTDDPVTTETPIKAVHVNEHCHAMQEVRKRIDIDSVLYPAEHVSNQPTSLRDKPTDRGAKCGVLTVHRPVLVDLIQQRSEPDGP